MPERKLKKCWNCKTYFTPFFRQTKYCSEKCFAESRKEQKWKRYWSLKNKTISPISYCANCNKEFKKKFNWKTCSRVCSQLYTKKRFKAWSNEWRLNNLAYFTEYQKKYHKLKRN